MSDIVGNGEPGDLAASIDAIEEAYEYMLAYAASARTEEGEDSFTGIRAALVNVEAGLGTIIDAATELEEAPGGGSEFFILLRNDAGRARAVVRFALAQMPITSQLVDNLNASIHLRTLLTDLFLLDEALRITGIGQA